MKKTIIAAIAFAAISSTSAFAATAGVAGGTVKFHGKVTDTSCTISVNGQGADSDVYLNPISKTEITAADTLLKAKAFNIDVSGCSAAEGKDTTDLAKISLAWTGGYLLANDKGYLDNQDSSATTGAKNVQLALSADTTIAGHIVPADAGQKTVSADISAVPNTARFTYNVGYVTSTPADVTSGTVSSYAIYEVNYQ